MRGDEDYATAGDVAQERVEGDPVLVLAAGGVVDAVDKFGVVGRKEEEDRPGGEVRSGEVEGGRPTWGRGEVR